MQDGERAVEGCRERGKVDVGAHFEIHIQVLEGA
jgi:hypothetical protein